MLKWANKQNNFNIYDAPFKKKNKEKHLKISFYTLYQKSRYDLQFLRYKV